MDQIKIGKFIAECRKKNKLTQMQLAEKLNITDRAISKWENGKAMPDSSIMLDLCNELKISVNELLSGEMIDMKDYDKKTEQLLLELAKQDEIKNKKLMFSMWTILITSIVFYIGILIIATKFIPEGIMLGTIIVVSTIIFLIAGFISLKFEVDAGYYECKNCHNKFIPKYKEVFWAAHMGTIRHLKCPKCNKRTWAKKVMTK
ncbi:MAG: helix-turn-helix domain-containing protein [Clostridia bacterium]|nr:helix-turn-helix domain-containing protein [Clostridia bacterium]